MDTLLPTQPSSYKELIKNSLKLYRVSFSRIIILSFFLSLVIFIPRFLSDVIGQEIFLNVPPLSPHRLWLLAVNLIGITFFIGILWRMHCIIRGFHEPLIEDLTVGIKKVIYVFAATLFESAILFAVAIAIYGFEILIKQHHLLLQQQLMMTALITLIFVLQFLLLVYISTLFVFFIPILAIENKGVIGSFEQSVLLVWNHWWRVLSLQFSPWICYLILLILIRSVLGIDIHLYFFKYTTHSIIATLLHFIIFALFIPWVAATLLVQLKDLELRKKIKNDKKS